MPSRSSWFVPSISMVASCALTLFFTTYYHAPALRHAARCEQATENLRDGDIVVHRLANWRGIILRIYGDKREFVDIRAVGGDGSYPVWTGMYAHEWRLE